MKYAQLFSKKNKEYYSLNFLLANFEKVEDIERDTKVIENHIICSRFDTKNLKTRFYYKQISTCIE